jgi:hypothetical protein
MPKPAASAPASRQPYAGYATILALGLLPTALVTRYYDIIPRRIVIQWDTFGNTTIIGTRSTTLLMIANAAALIALISIAVAVWQHRSLIALGARRAFLALNLAQIVTINLTCAMIVSDALGLKLAIKPMIPPAMAVLLFAAAVLIGRMNETPRRGLTRGVSLALGGAGVLLLAFSAVALNAAVGYFAAALAALAMVAIALPAER